jgi:hypothetical protein
VATNPKIKPCPKCGSEDVNVIRYDSGWTYVECDNGFNVFVSGVNQLCGYRGPPSGSIRWAIKLHNKEVAKQRATV